MRRERRLLTSVDLPAPLMPAISQNQDSSASCPALGMMPDPISTDRAHFGVRKIAVNCLIDAFAEGLRHSSRELATKRVHVLYFSLFRGLGHVITIPLARRAGHLARLASLPITSHGLSWLNFQRQVTNHPVTHG